MAQRRRAACPFSYLRHDVRSRGCNAHERVGYRYRNRRWFMAPF